MLSDPDGYRDQNDNEIELSGQPLFIFSSSRQTTYSFLTLFCDSKINILFLTIKGSFYPFSEIHSIT
ncbi:MAG: hypothetical protein COC06_08535 [Bacteroidales bacterium]|nr:MAG: hypothetical protein COC06_12685 [Bacteroidales bacterium]PCH68870.1 MAG: hypothetical protein COC06_08535 [Bacteroidales bacterium]